jgi:hypothetical protein
MSCNVKYDLCVSQNASFDFVFNVLQSDAVTPVSIASWSFTGSVKQTTSDITPVTYFTCSVLSIPSASVKLFLTAQQTWLFTDPRYVYDVLANDTSTTPTTTYRLLEGNVNVDFGVTPP